MDPVRLILLFLHLLGFDHAEPEDEREMFQIQRDILVGAAMQEKARG